MSSVGSPLVGEAAVARSAHPRRPMSVRQIKQRMGGLYEAPLARNVLADTTSGARKRGLVRLLSCECAVTDAENRVLARSTATYMLVPQG